MADGYKTPTVRCHRVRAGVSAWGKLNTAGMDKKFKRAVSHKLYRDTSSWSAIQQDSGLVVLDKTKISDAKGSQRHSKDEDPCWRESRQAARSNAIAVHLPKKLINKQRDCKKIQIKASNGETNGRE